MDFTLTPRDNEALRRIQTREHIAPAALRTLVTKGYIVRGGNHRPVRALTQLGRAFLSLHQGSINNDLVRMNEDQWEGVEAETAELITWLDTQPGRVEDRIQARIRLLAVGLLRKGYYTY